MVSLLGGIVAIVLGVVALCIKWYGVYGVTFLLKGLIAVVPALLVLGGCVAIGAGIGSIRDKVRSKEEEKKPEEKPEPKAEPKVEEKSEEKLEEKSE